MNICKHSVRNLVVLCLVYCFEISFTLADIRDPRDQKFVLWPNIPLVRATDFREYVLDRDVFKELHLDKADPEGILKALGAVDTLHGSHHGPRTAGIAEAFNSDFIGSIDALAREHRVTPKLNFSFEGISPVELQANPLGKKDIKALRKKAAHVTLIALGSYSNIGNKNIRVTLHFIKLHTGESQTFMKVDHIQSVAESLAQDVFDYFQAGIGSTAIFPGFKRTLSSQWLLPAPGHKNMKVNHTMAEVTCKSQGARLPNEYEMMAGQASGPYSHGISLIRDSMYHLETEGQLYFSSESNDPRGQVRTSGALPRNAYYYCIKEKP